MTTIYADFETYYDKDYSLSKLNTLEYVMDPRFLVLGTAYCVDDGPAQYCQGLPDLDWPNATVVAHNMLFDGTILHMHYGISPKRYQCTQSIAQAKLMLPSYALKYVAPALGLGEKTEGLTEGSSENTDELIAYALNDVELCRKIYQTLPIPDHEREVLHHVLKWGCEPKLIANVNKLEQAAQEAEQKRKEIILASGVDEKTLTSQDKFAEYLISEGIEVPMKENTKGWPIPALALGDHEFLAMINNNPSHKHVFDGRIAAKSNILIKRPRQMAAIARTTVPSHGVPLLPMPLKYYGAHTGRMCIAEGSLITTNEGVIPIEELKPHQLVWDGEEFVSHQGLAYAGIKEVMTYDGVRATPDHKVFTENGKMPISEAYARGIPIKSGPIPSQNKSESLRERQESSAGTMRLRE